MRLPIYLDYMATTPVDPRIALKMQHYLTLDGVFGNSHSQHIYGQEAHNAIEDARAKLAKLLNTSSESLFWTSGATEANNLAIKGSAFSYQRQGKHIITCKTEHKAVLDCCEFLARQGFTVTYLSPETNGLIDLDKLKAAIRHDTILVSIMQVNNEIGVVQDIAAIGRMTRERGILLHVDAAQSLGKISIDLSTLPVDLMSFSAHKFYGPKGIGALYIRQTPRIHLELQMHGGNQERGLRSGTLPTHQIVGMGEAATIAMQEMTQDNERILKLRQRLWDGIKQLGNIQLNGSETTRIAGNLNVSFKNIEGETLLIALQNLAVSAASACVNAQFEPSYVLRALGVSSELALNSIRFSLGKYTTEEEIDYAINYLTQVVTALKQTSSYAMPQ